MKLCVVSFKGCWRGAGGEWYSSGGFPLQMQAISGLFDATTLAIVETPPLSGGIALPRSARVVPLTPPQGSGWRRKRWVVLHLPTYGREISRAMEGADVVHTPLPGDIQYLGLLIALARGKRVIARYGGSWFGTSQTTLMNRVTRATMRLLAGSRHVMLATGERSVPPSPGIDWLFASALSRAELERVRVDFDRGWSRPPRLVFIGRLSSEKGLSLLFEALEGIRAEGRAPMPVLTLVGEGPERPRLEAHVRRAGLESAVRFAGQQNREGLSRELQLADLCVQPSLSEGFSKAWLDAMAHGLPVLSSNVGAAESVTGTHGERGWLVPAGDAAALRGRLEEVLRSEPDWPSLRRRCREFAESRTLEKWGETIGQICARRWNARLVDGRLEACAP